MRKHSPSDFVVILPSSIITIPQDSYFGYLPLFYALPKELVEKCPVYLNLPRNILTLIADDQSHDMLNDSFLELVLDCYAWSIWQFLQVPKKDGSNQDIPGDWSNYSGDFLRSWNHDRNHTHLSIEQIAEAGASIDGNALYELDDPRGEYETKILSEVQIEQFQTVHFWTTTPNNSLRRESSYVSCIAAFCCPLSGRRCNREQGTL